MDPTLTLSRRGYVRIVMVVMSNFYQNFSRFDTQAVLAVAK